MKKMAVAALIIGFSLTALLSPVNAAQISFVSASASGSVNNSPSLVIDNSIPPEWQYWQTNTVWWNGTSPAITLDMGGAYTLEEIIISVDNNDSYRVDYSLNNSEWAQLFLISSGWGEVGSGMDTMSSISGDPEFIEGINFPAVSARYLRIQATGGDNMYSVGELQAFGAPVPVPPALILLGSGLIGLLGLGRKKALFSTVQG